MTPEHQNGVMRNNLVVNCSDVGIYLNEAKSTTIVNNTVVETRGIDARFQATDAEIRNDLLTGRIKDRDGGTSTRSSNLVEGASTLENWFPDPSGADFSAAMGQATDRLVDSGEMVDVQYDYCGDLRDDGSIDIGAIEYTEGSACDTTQFGHGVETTARDTGVGDGDAGDVGMSDDTGTSADTMSAPDTGSDSTTDGGASDAGDAGSSADGGSDGEGCGCSSHSSPAPAGVLFALCVVAAVGRRTSLSVRRSTH